MGIIRTDYWTETAILALPPGEDDNFERKSGRMLDDPKFRVELGKALSAFSNSGGGHVLIGVDDKGVIDGVPADRAVSGGRTMATRDWIEQLVPGLVDYPLTLFRAQAVPITDPAMSGRVVIVINVPDSQLSPHQNKEDRVYYLRQSGRSRPAPHTFVDLLRHRPNAATLETRLDRLSHYSSALKKSGKLSVALRLTGTVSNTSMRELAEVHEVILNLTGTRPDLPQFVIQMVSSFERKILPSTSCEFEALLLFEFESPEIGVGSLRERIGEVLHDGLAFEHRAASNSWGGVLRNTSVASLIDLDKLSERCEKAAGTPPL